MSDDTRNAGPHQETHPRWLSFASQYFNGPQQVNNVPSGAVTQPDSSRARESENPPNELLERQRNEWLDGGTAQAPGSSYPPVEAVEAIRRTKDDRG
jgi:hypothetical protein